MNGNYSNSPEEESATGRPDRDPLASQDDPAKFLTQHTHPVGDVETTLRQWIDRARAAAICDDRRGTLAYRGPRAGTAPPPRLPEPLVVKRRVSVRGAIMVGGQKIQIGRPARLAAGLPAVRAAAVRR
jgi:hypothetical protein